MEGTEQPMTLSPRSRTDRPSSENAKPEQRSTRSRMRQLIGDQRKRIAAIGVLAILSAFVEAINLALLAQIATTLVRVNGAHPRILLLHIRAPTKTLLIAALILAVARVVLLQLPLTLLPARITTISWGRLRMGLFDA